jgi:hypothetical protein
MYVRLGRLIRAPEGPIVPTEMTTHGLQQWGNSLVKRGRRQENTGDFILQGEAMLDAKESLLRVVTAGDVDSTT